VKAWIVNVYWERDFIRSAAVFDTYAEAVKHAQKCEKLEVATRMPGCCEYEFVVEELKDWP
jgi:hypothetical protein